MKIKIKFHSGTVRFIENVTDVLVTRSIIYITTVISYPSPEKINISGASYVEVDGDRISMIGE